MIKLTAELTGSVSGTMLFLDETPQPAGQTYEWYLTPGAHTIRVEKLPAIFCRGWMGRVFLYHLSMMSTEFSLQSVMENADAWVMKITVEPERELHLRIKATETRLMLTEGNMHCKEIVLTRSASPEAIRKVKLAYLMPVMVLFGLLTLLFAGGMAYFAATRNMGLAILFALGTAGWCIFSWKNLHRLWHSDRKTKKQ